MIEVSETHHELYVRSGSDTRATKAPIPGLAVHAVINAWHHGSSPAAVVPWRSGMSEHNYVLWQQQVQRQGSKVRVG